MGRGRCWFWTAHSAGQGRLSSVGSKSTPLEMCLHPRIPKTDTTKGHRKATQKILCNVCEMRVVWDLHEFPATVITVCPRRGEVGLEATQVCFLTVLESGIQNQLVSRVGHFQGSEGQPAPCLSLLFSGGASMPQRSLAGDFVTPASSWVFTRPSSCVRTSSSFWAYLCPNLLPPIKTPVIWG